MRNRQLSEQKLLPFRPSGDIPSEQGWLYHATNEEGAADIFQDGQFNVHPPWHGTDQSSWPDGAEEPRAYFTPKARVAWQFAPEHGQSVILRVPEGSGEFRHESTGDIYAKRPVDASNAQILASDGIWHPLKEFSQMTEAFGGRPVGDANAQSANANPDFITPAGVGGVPEEEVEPEFKPEEFEAELEQYLMDAKGQDMVEVDHPEFMPQEGPARYDPELELGKPEQRQAGYNTGSPDP